MSQTTYDLPWWNMSERCKKILLHMTVGAQKPPTMTGGRHFPINLETFLAVSSLKKIILKQNLIKKIITGGQTVVQYLGHVGANAGIMGLLVKL